MHMHMCNYYDMTESNEILEQRFLNFFVHSQLVHLHNQGHTYVRLKMFYTLIGVQIYIHINLGAKYNIKL